MIHHYKPGLTHALPVALCVLAGVVFWYWQGHFSYLPGTDAYYYALQAQSILTTGHLKVPGNGVLYYAIALIAKTGIPIETAFRIILASIFTLVNLAFWFYVSRMPQHVRVWAVILVLIAWPLIAFQTIEFPRQTLALAMLPVLLRMAEADAALKHPRFWLVLGVSVLLHPLLAVLDVLLVAYLLFIAWQKRRQAGKRIGSPRIVLLLVVITGFIIFTLTSWPGLMARLTSLSSGMPGLLALCLTPGLPLDLKAVLVLLWLLLACIAVFTLVYHRRKFTYLPLLVCALALWPGPETGLSGLGGRLALAFGIIALPVIFSALNALNAWKTQRPSSLMSFGYVATAAIPAIAILLLLAMAPPRMNTYSRLLANHDYAQYEKVVAFMRQRNISLLIARQGLDYYYTYRLQRDAFHFDPEPWWDITRIWRVAARVTPEELVFYAPDTCLWNHTAMPIPGTSLNLVREDCWERFRSHIAFQDNPDLYRQVRQDAENPSQPRPAFLRKKYQHVANSME